MKRPSLQTYISQNEFSYIPNNFIFLFVFQNFSQNAKTRQPKPVIVRALTGSETSHAPAPRPIPRSLVINLNRPINRGVAKRLASIKLEPIKSNLSASLPPCLTLTAVKTTAAPHPTRYGAALTRPPVIKGSYICPPCV